MNEMHRRISSNWINFMYSAFYEQEEYDMNFDDLCDQAMEADLMEFGFDEIDHPWNADPGFVGVRRALESVERTIHKN